MVLARKSGVSSVVKSIVKWILNDNYKRGYPKEFFYMTETEYLEFRKRFSAFIISQTIGLNPDGTLTLTIKDAEGTYTNWTAKAL